MQNIVKTYSGLARNYDLDEKLLLFAGIRLGRYRKDAVKELNLRKGDTVVDLGCGTGLNFKYIQDAIGPEGKIIGVDITRAMLDEAEKRITKNNWKNVELVCSDMSKFEIPETDAVISTCAITLVPGFAEVIRNASNSLRPGGRFAILDFKKPKWPMWIIRIAARLFIEPFGGSLEMGNRHPWVQLEEQLKKVLFREYYFGGMYLAVGEK